MRRGRLGRKVGGVKREGKQGEIKVVIRWNVLKGEFKAERLKGSKTLWSFQ